MLLFKYGKFKIKIYRKWTIKEFWRLLFFRLFYDKRAEADGRDIKIPDHELEALARAILPDIIKFFESEKAKASLKSGKANRSA